MKVRASESKPSLLEFAERSRSSIDLKHFKYMKKITNVEIRFYNLNAQNVIATSGPNSISYAGSNAYGGPNVAEVGGRDYYDGEDW